MPSRKVLGLPRAKKGTKFLVIKESSGRFIVQRLKRREENNMVKKQRDMFPQFKVTAAVGKRRTDLGTFRSTTTLNKLVRGAKDIKKRNPFADKSTLIIQRVRNGKKFGKPRILKI